MTRRILSILVAALMLMALMPMSALAKSVEPASDELDAALNVEGGTLSFTSEGDYPWIVVTDEETGRVYAQSGNAGQPNSSSKLELNAELDEGLAIVFDFKAWGEGSNWDVCIFAIDETQKFRYGALDNDWTEFSAYLEPGAHLLTWTFAKDNSTNGTGDYFAVDNVRFEEYVAPPAPVIGYYFESDDEIADFTMLDVDGDGHTWNRNTGGAYEGTGIMRSRYNGNTNTDNWMILPEAEIPAVDPHITLYAKSYSITYGIEVFGIFIGTDPTDLTTFVQVGTEIEADHTAYEQYDFDLSDYAGQSAYIAVRHFDCSNTWFLIVDQVELWGENGDEPEPTEPANLIDTIEINDFVVPAWGEHPFFNVSVPEEAEYEIEETAWVYYNNAGVDGELTSDDVFDRTDVAYYQSFKVVPLEGYSFADEVTILINGSAEYVYENTTNQVDEHYQVETIDFVVTDPDFAENLDAALNVPGGTLHFGTNDLDLGIDVYPWFTVDEGEDGRFYAKSGNGGIDSSSSGLWTMFSSVEGDVLAFDFKAWGEGSGWDTCEFYVDEHRIFSYDSLDNEWQTYVYPLEPGEHMAAWAYNKDGSVNPIGDYFAVDNVYVGEPVYPESIEADDVEVMVNHNVQIDWTVLPEDATWKNVTFESADENIAMVDKNGVVRGITEGVTEITIRISYEVQEPEPEPYPTGYYKDEPEYPDVYTTITVTVIPVKDLVVGYYFETQPEDDGWQFIDADGDDFNWHWNFDDEYFGEYTAEWAYEGEGFIMSDSYYGPYSSEGPQKNEIGVQGYQLMPDNWAISPAIELPNESAWVTFFASSFLYPDALESIEVYVGLTDDITEMENVMEATYVTAVTCTFYEIPVNYMQFDVDLSDYLGETVYIAIRHFIPEGDEHANCFLAVDMFEVFGTEGGPIIVDEIRVDGYEFPPMAGYESMNHLNLTTPEDAPYYVDFDWTNWYDEDAGFDFFDRFIGGTNYSVYTTIQLPEGCEFADEVTIYVNGDTELVSEYVYFYGDHMVFYTVPFLCHMWGDANGDGELTTVDTLLIMRYSLGIEELEEELIDPWCDVNADGSWDFSDALLILRKVMEIIEFFPVECE